MVSCLVILIFATVNIVNGEAEAVQTVFDYINTIYTVTKDTHTHADTQTHIYTYTQTHRHTDTQTHRHTDTQTHRQSK